MDTLLDTRLDKKAFYEWLDGQEGRYELEDGRIIMVRVSKGHTRIVSNFIAALRSRLDLDHWAVTASDLAVEIGEQVRFPDVIVEPMDDQVKALETTTARLLVEVLSPSSVGRDFNLKLAEYKTLGSVEAYVIASQDEPICWIWQRAAGSASELRPFPDKPQEIQGRDKQIEIVCLGISLPLAEIYRSIGDH